MKKVILGLVVFAMLAMTVGVLSIASCKKAETTVTPAPPSNEFLTTVVYQCINQNTPYDTTCGVWRILPAWANADTSEALLKFHKGATYLCNVYILDESNTDSTKYVKNSTFNINNLNSSTVNVTSEIRARQNYHLICIDFTPDTLANNVIWTRLDFDTNNPPLQVGLNDQFVIGTTAVTTGRTEITLHHQPNVKNGTCGPGTDDFDVTYGTMIY